ncbi:uncharacterized protein [Spinacia oleracea]|uniref:FAR1 domain-containing protein n=1 Tax=Spinacia oleracea TaxID=3562 RepID=A0A9R0K5D8_SPIOL|nr:uncharacterized protein LOC110797556 [Spinacia oleracea]
MDDDLPSTPLSSSSASAATWEIPLPDDYGGDGKDYSDHFVTNDIFPSFEEAAEWAKQVAIGLGFLLTKMSYKQFKDGRGYRYLKCDRGRRKSARDMEAAERLDTKTKACGCKFEVKCVQRMDFAWQIVKREGHGTHNHSLVVYEEGHRGISGLSPGAKNLIHQMNNAHAKPKVIMSAVQTEYPDDHPNMRHIYNYNDKIRRDAHERRNPAQQFLHLAKEHKYVQWIAVEEGSRAVTHAFVAHPSMVEVLRTYPLVIGMDTTYKTNKYGHDVIGMDTTYKTTSTHRSRN